MDLTQHFNASLNPVPSQARKENKSNWPGVGCFSFALFILPKYLILDIDK